MFIILFVSEFLVIGKGTVDVEKRGDLEFLIISGVPMYFATILNMFEGNAIVDTDPVSRAVSTYLL